MQCRFVLIHFQIFRGHFSSIDLWNGYIYSEKYIRRERLRFRFQQTFRRSFCVQRLSIEFFSHNNFIHLCKVVLYFSLLIFPMFHSIMQFLILAIIVATTIRFNSFPRKFLEDRAEWSQGSIEKHGEIGRTRLTCWDYVWKERGGRGGASVSPHSHGSAVCSKQRFMRSLARWLNYVITAWRGFKRITNSIMTAERVVVAGRGRQSFVFVSRTTAWNRGGVPYEGRKVARIMALDREGWPTRGSFLPWWMNFKLAGKRIQLTTY